MLQSLLAGIFALVIFAPGACHEDKHWEWAEEFQLSAGNYVWSAAQSAGDKHSATSMKLLIYVEGSEPSQVWEKADKQDMWREIHSQGSTDLDGQNNVALKLTFDMLSWISYFKFRITKACKIRILTDHSPTEFLGPLNEHYLRMADGTNVNPIYRESDHEYKKGEVVAGEDVTMSKVLGIASICLSALGGIVLRLKCPAFDSPRLFGYINVLAGSMFVAMALFHILPEAIHHAPPSMQTLLTSDPSPMGVMLFVFLGFSLVLVFERVLFDAHGSQDRPGPETYGDAPNSARNSETQEAAALERRTSSQSTQCIVCASFEVCKFDVYAFRNCGDRNCRDRNCGQAGSRHANGHGAGGHGCGHGVNFNQNSTISAVLLMGALCVHSLFEGVVIGTADSVGTVWLLVAIVVSHEWAAAFAITSQVTQQLQGGIVRVLLLLFALASPLGALLGWFIDEIAEEGGSPAAKLMESILNSLAVGTLLYIGMVEVVPEEFAGARNATAKFLVFMCAASFVLVFTVLHLEYGHSHSAHAGHSHGVHNHNHVHAHKSASKFVML